MANQPSVVQDYVMLTAWLRNTPSTLPPNASHQVCECIYREFG